MESNKEQARVRVNYKVSAKGLVQPDFTSEAETVDTAIKNLEELKAGFEDFARKNDLNLG
jgi:hypothetical protein